MMMYLKISCACIKMFRCLPLTLGDLENSYEVFKDFMVLQFS